MSGPGVLAIVFVALNLNATAVPSRDQSPPTYDVKVELDHTSTGTTTFAVDAAGKVSGKMHLDTPNEVEAMLSGAVKDGTWTFEYPFSMPAQGCSGVAAGSAKVTADRSLVSGSVTVSGGCTDQPLTGTFTFSKRSQ